MEKKQVKLQLISLTSSSVSTLFTHPQLFLPFITVAFVQLLFLEILYFMPRWPLNVFFGPIIERMAGEVYLHYPFHLVLLPKMFQYVQIPIYIFISSFMVAVAVSMIYSLNSNKKVSFAAAIKATFSHYIHIVAAGLIAFMAFWGVYQLYGLVVNRAVQITSTSGKFYILKMAVLKSSPYVNLLIGVLITALFAYLYPIIVIEKQRIFSALIQNFKKMGRSVFFIFFLVLLPTLFYLPVLLIRSNINSFAELTIPSSRILVLAASVLAMLIIDAIVYTSIATHYLLRKENK